MEYTAPAIPLTISKDPNRDKSKEPALIAKETAKEHAKPAKDPTENAALTKGFHNLFALSQDFEGDPVHQLVVDALYVMPAHRRYRPQKTTANAVVVVFKPYAMQV
ncbi:hypothetical protein DSO57_1018801 [Entomophthora muscae]|uniref:Uncharacterized protein n=1 Tax=Entomophthora muscae TaxID=34485 RepID=A0ACC2T483_9FUNG|nr:hypothetical protein DSO57_1018801 [Entomophthora muscae]